MGWRGTSNKTSAWPKGWWHVMLTCSSTTLDHKMPVVGWGGASRGQQVASVGIGVTYEKWRWSFCKVLLKTEDSLLQTIEHELRPTGPKLVLVLATRCLYLVCLTEGQPDPKADKMSSWPDVVPLLAIRCLYWEVCLTENQPDPKGWPNVKLTWHSTNLT